RRAGKRSDGGPSVHGLRDGSAGSLGRSAARFRLPGLRLRRTSHSRRRELLLGRDPRAGAEIDPRGPHPRPRLRLDGNRHSCAEPTPAPRLFGNGRLMTDFLSRLVERSLGMATVLRPVVPPLFAPGTALAEPDMSAPPSASPLSETMS